MPVLSTGAFFNSGGGGSTPPDPDDYVANDGATVPWIGSGLTTPAFYDATLGKTFMSWEAFVNDARSQQIAIYDHASGYWSDIEGMGVMPIADDSHGSPGIVLDDEDYLHAFYGSHNTNMRYSSTRWAVGGAEVEGSHWIIRPEIAGEYTYPHPVMVGDTIYLFMREWLPGSTSAPLVLYKTTALAGGVATWGSEETLVTFSTNSRFYMGDAILNGTDIWIVATNADFNDTARKGVYLFILDTTDGSLRNYDGSLDTAAGSLPIGITISNASHRIFDHGSNQGEIPAACFDTTGTFHICFLDGTGTSYAIKHVSITSGVLSSVTTIATIKASIGSGGFVEVMALVPLAGGEIELWYPEDEAEAWNYGGNMTRRVRSAGGVWGSAETILTATTNALARPSAVVNGHADARVVFTEITQSESDSGAGGLKVYLWGASGFVGYQQAPAAPPPSSTADGVELREDGFAELREDGFDELREVVI